MSQDISTLLSNVIEKRRLRDKIKRNLGAVQAELQRESDRLKSLEDQLAKEKADVDSLERMSLTALFYTVLGSRAEQTEKERQELLAAQLKYQKGKFLVTSLESERGRLEEQLVQFEGIDTEYETLLNEKERLLRLSDQATERELVAIAEQAASLRAEIRELEEAIRAGEVVQQGLERVIRSLESAKGWGVWDMLGGGLLSTAIKHDRINQARAAVFEVQAQMGLFKRELADVNQNARLKIEISEFETFADYFFDGLIFDWIVQSKIVNSLEHTQRTMENITQTIQELQQLLLQASGRLNTLEEKRVDLIENR
ncbi:MAG TPA: hypothetical protein VLA49_16285 [Anaerolineales bacterium]|nr:hypothetical protein [Anaerolineales bacterium]